MLDPQAIHNEVYDLLIKYWQNELSFYFTFRRSNRDGRLDKGYWFYGNDEYVAVSFWTGMDWKNRTPNIIFVVLVDGETYLEINTSDSDEKRQFVNDYLVDKLQLEPIGKRYKKNYVGNYLTVLETFINNDKKVIDDVISEYAKAFFSNIDSGIFFIDKIDFEEQKNKIDKYKKKVLEDDFNQQEFAEKAIKINEIEISNYGPIKKLLINEIPFSSQWIFFTGENGTGKTSILRSIAIAVCESDKTELTDKDFKVSLKLFTSSNQLVSYDHQNLLQPQTAYPLTKGFAAYGQSRLKTNHSGASAQLLKSITPTTLTSSLFNEETYLLDLQNQFQQWQIDQRASDRFKKRKDYIIEVLTDVLPNLYNINFNDSIGDIAITTYIEKDHDGAEFKKVTFDKLASGLKSMIAMIGDILIRLYEQQPDVYDPSEFTGIVLIDEIDIHLHPKLQKQIVQQLTKTFPKIQFIVSTHSPIPFLGAPKNSQIFKVERLSEEGVKVKRLDELLELGDLLPNTILTSPIFGLADIVPDSHDQKKLVRTETTYSDMSFNDKVQQRIASFLTDEKEQELINLFKSRRK